MYQHHECNRLTERCSQPDPAFRARLFLAETEDRSWPILLILLAVHVLLFLVVAGFFWLHIKRLNRPRWFPEVHWVAGMALLLLIGAPIFPLGMLAPADPGQLPGPVRLDSLFLFYLPTSGATAGLWLWGGLIAAAIALAALPWLSRRKDQPKVQIIKDRCTGCTKCALDCPYNAITMVERHDGKPHKFIAIEDPSLCVSCGICIGSCDSVAVTLGDTPPEQLWQTVEAQMILARANSAFELRGRGELTIPEFQGMLAKISRNFSANCASSPGPKSVQQSTINQSLANNCLPPELCYYSSAQNN